MKFSLVFLAIVGFAAAASFAPYGLKEDIDRLRSLIPVDKIRSIIRRYLDNGDPEVLAIAQYVKSDEFQSLGNKVWNIPEVREAVDDLEKRGLNVREVINDIATIVGIPNLPGGYASATRGWKAMTEEIKKEIPFPKILVTALELLQTSPDFQQLYKRVTSQETRTIFQKIVAIPEVQSLEKKLRKMGIDVDRIVKEVHDALGWN